MKLIFFTIILVIYFTFKVESQKLREFQFPSPFQTLRPTMFTSESSHYLPPESQTAIPYFPMKNENKLPFQYLPPTGTKAPSVYPTPYPMMISSAPRQNSDDEGNDENDNDVTKLHLTSPQSQTQVKKNNQTSIQQMNAHVQNREMRILPRTVYNEHPVDRIDIKYPSSERIEVTTLHPIQQAPATRRTIISAETQRNDHIFDLDKSASMMAPQYMHPGFVMSSTTEPAIPILRLSNEMDLDGSFSYEALGADQTHYVQHSHMENAGTDKEEQVVEGSYSYVGDNGQTYTVHYVADSNGFRASGDHLPVPPPIPEIIQRSIQYNLAAEAKKPPHMKSWNDDNNGQESMDSERNQDLTVLPVRHLFTGRTPEAFTYGFTQEAKALNNVGVASSQAPFQTNSDFAKDQTQIKDNIGTIISPQVTFLASQGAHAPSANLAQQSVAKLFPNEKTAMPQLINYEAVLKEPVQDNKPLWRWQYGYGNNFNPNSNKNTISRSEGDEVMVNFNDMTPDQYTNMINSQFTIDNTEQNTSEAEISAFNRNFHEKDYQGTQNLHNQPQDPEKELLTTTESSHNWLHSTNLYLRPIGTRLNPNKDVEIMRPTDNENSNHNNHEISSTPSGFYSDSLLDNYSELRKKNLRDNNAIFQTNTGTINTDDIQNVSTTSEVNSEMIIYSTSSQIPKTDFNFERQNDKQNDIYSLRFHKETDNKEPTTTTDSSIEDIFEKNIFLKNLFRSIKQQEKNESKAIEETPQHQLKIIHPELKPDKFPKPVNKKTTLDMSDILNYMTVKNHFESNKIKSKSKPQPYDNLNHNNEDKLTPKNGDEERLKYYSEDRNRFHILNPQSSEELHGNIRNYKVLQRNNHVMSTEQGSSDQLRNYLNQQVNQFKHTQSQPPLGRAGPSMKSYLPPIYV